LRIDGLCHSILYSIGTTGTLHLKIPTYTHDVFFVYHSNMAKIWNFEVTLDKFNEDICTWRGSSQKSDTW